MRKKVPLQKAKLSQILLIDERFNKSNYIDLTDIIYNYSERNIYGENEQINYSDYNSFKYDYDAIEEQLGKIILPGVCQFESEKELNFVTFWSEGFRGGRSQILIEFSSKYKQKPLDEKEKENIVRYIIEELSENYDFKDFFGSLQMLIFYLTETEILEKNLKAISENLPTYLRLSEDFKNFFSNEKYKLNELTIEKILNIFIFIEHFCFKDLVETLHNEYKEKISPEKQKEIVKKLKISSEDIYTKKDLAAAVRRFISRYLAGKLEVADVNENRDLADEIYREDLWDENILKKGDLQIAVGEKIREFKLKVGQAYEFYKLICQEDKLLIEENSAVTSTYEFITKNYDFTTNLKKISMEDLKNLAQSNSLVNTTIDNFVDKVGTFKKNNIKDLLFDDDI